VTPTDPPGSQPWDDAPQWDGVEPWASPGQPPAEPRGVTPSTDPNARPAVRRRPIMMAIAGLFGGLGVAFLLIHYARIALGTNAPVIVVAIGVAFGVALAYTLPPRRPRSQR
jgi:hypothetical protein